MRDPRRRNRNIGTAKSGHGQDNSLSIPRYWDKNDRVYYGQLNNAVRIERKRITFLIEPTLEDHFHPCTPQEILEVLWALPSRDMMAIRLVILRQPTRKQKILCPVWGRLVYFADWGRFFSPAIILEAQRLAPIRWSRKLDISEQAELRRLEADGHVIEDKKSEFLIRSSREAIIATQLFRTIPHEVGHYADYIEKVQDATDSEKSWEERWDLYHARPAREKEDFAHRYAREMRPKVVRPLRSNEERRESVVNDGLNPTWFGLS